MGLIDDIEEGIETALSHATCKVLGLFNLCKNEDGNIVWAPTLKKIENVVVGIYAVSGFVMFVGGLFFVSLVFKVDFGFSPVELAFDVLRKLGDFGFFLAEEWVKLLDWIADLTGTYRELWTAVGITSLTLAFTAFMNDVIGYIFKEDSTGWPMRIFEGLSWISETFKALLYRFVPSLWNPLHWAVAVFFGLWDVLAFFLAPVLNLFNPLQWFDWFKKLFFYLF